MKFTIYRPNWRRGGDHPPAGVLGETLLLNTSGFACCLGQCALQLGLSKDEILGVAEPGNFDSTLLRNTVDPLFQRRVKADDTHTRLDWEAMLYNDAEPSLAPGDLTPDEMEAWRENALSRIFGIYGHEIEFTDEPAPWA